MNKSAAMEAVRDLSWATPDASVFPECAVEAHTGFEPVLQETGVTTPDAGIPGPLGQKLAQLRTEASARRGRVRRR
jgi:hypothetical protein